MARNTAPAIALATLHVAARDPEGVLAVLPSDHHVADVGGIPGRARPRGRGREAGALVTIGIQPTRPETGYGYIRVGERARRRRGAGARPSWRSRTLATAKGVPRVGRVPVERRHLRLPRRRDARGVRRAHARAGGGAGADRSHAGNARYAAALKKRLPEAAPAISIDYGVMEKAREHRRGAGRLRLVRRGQLRRAPRGAAGRRAQGNVVVGRRARCWWTAAGCVVVGDERPLAVVGLQDMVVVDAGRRGAGGAARTGARTCAAVVQSLRARGLGKFE